MEQVQLITVMIITSLLFVLFSVFKEYGFSLTIGQVKNATDRIQERIKAEGHVVAEDDKEPATMMFRRYEECGRNANRNLLIAILLVVLTTSTLAGFGLTAHDTYMPNIAFYQTNLLTFLERTIAKVGLVTIVVYVASILIGQYRYQMKLSVFYRSMFYAIILKDRLEEVHLTAWMKTVHPPFDMDKNNTPFKDMLKLMDHLNQQRPKA